jgi:hypothetical protein
MTGKVSARRLSVGGIRSALILGLATALTLPSGVSPAAASATRCAAHAPATVADYQAVPDHRSAKFGIGDITSIVRLPDGRRFFTLGDTGYYNLEGDGSAGPLVGFGNNSAWVQSGNCFSLLDRPGPGARSWLLPTQQDGTVFWPGASVAVGPRLYVFLSRLFLNRPFGTPVGESVAVFDLPSLRLARLVPVPFLANRIFGGGAVYDGGYIYTYASQRPCKNCFAADMYVARVPESQVGDPLAWRYRAATTWVADARGAKPVLSAAVSTTDIQPYGNGFLLKTKTFSIVSPNVEAWWSANPVGPWLDLGQVASLPDPPPSLVPGFQYKQSYTYNVIALTSTRFADGGFLGSYNVNTFDPSEARRDGRLTGPRFFSIQLPPPPAAPPRPVVQPGPSPWVPTFAVDQRGRVRSVNGGVTLTHSYTTHAVGVVRTPTARGGWVVASDGGVFTFGDAHYYGSTGGIRLNQPIVGMASTPSGRGYWLVARDGGVFTFGDAHYRGSTGGIRLNQPIVGMASTPTGNGYWLFARDGGVFTFGDARFHGSTGGHTPSPVTAFATTPDGLGYWVVTLGGQVYAYGDANYGGNGPPGTYYIGIVASPGGYRVVDTNGRVITLGATRSSTHIPTASTLVAAG